MQIRLPVLILCTLLGCATGAEIVAAADATDARGKAIYLEQCARCHGRGGQGSKKHPDPLVGEWSRAQLAAVIARTMPDDDEQKCPPADAKDVAAFIYDAFYSPDARARLDPPRVALSHLTVRQYRNTVADLIASFGQAAKPHDARGLRGEYFAGRSFDDGRRVLERVDPHVKFDFGKLGPDGAGGEADEGQAGEVKKEGTSKFNPHQFCIRWEGSVEAAETGVYEFVVKSDQAVRLWVNDPKRPLIDASVKSGSDTEYRGSAPLLGGRSYLVRLEFAKGRELTGKKLAEAKPADASVALLWRVPGGGADEVVPARLLSPAVAPEVAVVATPFPPDDRSYGWERGTMVSREWVSAASDAAIEVAGYVAERLSELSGVSDDAPDRARRLRAFCRTLAERALRRPLSAQDEQQYVDGPFNAAAAADATLAVKRVVLRVLTSPRFLYPDAGTKSDDGYAAVSRLALALWDSTPDRALLDAAAAGRLSTRCDLVAQAERMLDDARARAKIREGLLAWLKLEQPPELAKDRSRFPGFDAAVAGDLRTSLEMSLDDAVWGDPTADFRRLLSSDEYFVNGRLAKVYGVDLPPDAEFTKVKLGGRQRAGVLTHPYLLSVLAYPAESSPIHRGVFVARNLLGITLRPPPEAFVPLPAAAHPEFTTRQRVAFQTRADACVRCHGVINPLGFPLEHFDAIGRFRQTENGKPIDANGSYWSRAGTTETFTDARGMVAYLAASDEVYAAFVEQTFQHLVKQPLRAYGLRKPRELRQDFAESGYSIRKLLVEIAVAAAQGPPAVLEGEERP